MIYPEAHIWPFYTKIRPFTESSFRYPIQNKCPVMCFTNTYQKRKFGKKAKIVTYIDGPFYADSSLKRKAQKVELRNRVYEAMVERSRNNTLVLATYIKKKNKGKAMRNILFSGNVKVFDGILTCMLSIFMRTKSKEPVQVLYIYNGRFASGRRLHSCLQTNRYRILTRLPKHIIHKMKL